MTRIYTCPHCGAGAGPRDTQCWRCGASLSSSPTADGKATPGIKELSKSGPGAAPCIKPVLRDVGGAYGREKELRDKEKALQAEMESLEAQNRKVEKLFRKLDEEKKSLESLKAGLSAREDDLYTKAAILQSAMKAAEVEPRAATPFNDTDRLAAVDPEPVLAMERARLRQELEKEMADQLDRITKLEESLSAQEDELYTKAALLQSAMKSADDPQNAGDISKNASIIYLAAGGDLEPVLVLERSRMRRKIESELAERSAHLAEESARLAERSARLAEREAALKAVYEQLGTGDTVLVSGPAGSVNATLASIQGLNRIWGGTGARFFRLINNGGAPALAEINAASDDQAKDGSTPAEPPAAPEGGAEQSNID